MGEVKLALESPDRICSIRPVYAVDIHRGDGLIKHIDRTQIKLHNGNADTGRTLFQHVAGIGARIGRKVFIFRPQFCQLGDRNKNIRNFIPGGLSNYAVLREVENALKSLNCIFRSGAEDAILRYAADKRIIAPDPIELCLQNLHIGSSGTQSQRRTGIGLRNVLDIIGFYQFDVVAIIIL